MILVIYLPVNVEKTLAFIGSDGGAAQRHFTTFEFNKIL